jgi:hypothetical protein
MLVVIRKTLAQFSMNIDELAVHPAVNAKEILRQLRKVTVLLVASHVTDDQRGGPDVVHRIQERIKTQPKPSWAFCRFAEWTGHVPDLVPCPRSGLCHSR